MAKKKSKKSLQKSIEELSEEIRLLRESQIPPVSTGNCMVTGNNRCPCGKPKWADASCCQDCGEKDRAWDNWANR